MTVNRCQLRGALAIVVGRPVGHAQRAIPALSDYTSSRSAY